MLIAVTESRFTSITADPHATSGPHETVLLLMLHWAAGQALAAVARCVLNAELNSGPRPTTSGRRLTMSEPTVFVTVGCPKNNQNGHRRTAPPHAAAHLRYRIHSKSFRQRESVAMLACCRFRRSISFIMALIFSSIRPKLPSSDLMCAKIFCLSSSLEEWQSSTRRVPIFFPSSKATATESHFSSPKMPSSVAKTKSRESVRVSKSSNKHHTPAICTGKTTP